jgi:hypothetical protein
MVQVARRALAACAFLAASGAAWPQSLPGSLASRPSVLQPVRAAQASDSTRPTRHRRTNRPRRSSASGEVASAFDTLASVVNTTPAPSRYRSRADRLASVRTLAAAEADPQLRIVISLNDRLLWAIIGSDTLLTAPVAVSMDMGFKYAGKTWRFETPRGVRTVLAKHENPVWVPPDWHYAEVAREHGLALAPMSAKKTKLLDGSWLEVRDSTIGIVDVETREFSFLPIDEEIVFDGTLFIPPLGTRNRRIEGELGYHSLDTGNGILLHGTRHKSSIGTAATHGCIRLRDQDISWLWEMVPLNRRVYIY